MAQPTRLENLLFTTGILSLDAGLHSAAGAVAASLTAANPAVGAIFGVGYFVASHAVNGVFQLIENTAHYPIDPNRTEAKVLKLGLSLIAGIGGGFLVASLLGLPLAFSAGATIAAAMVATTVTVGVLMCGGYYLQNLAIGPNLLLPHAHVHTSGTTVVTV